MRSSDSLTQRGRLRVRLLFGLWSACFSGCPCGGGSNVSILSIRKSYFWPRLSAPVECWCVGFLKRYLSLKKSNQSNPRWNFNSVNMKLFFWQPSVCVNFQLRLLTVVIGHLPCGNLLLCWEKNDMMQLDIPTHGLGFLFFWKTLR